MGIYNINISHKTAPVEVRALLAFSREEKTAFLGQVMDKKAVLECVLITTCNRTELYLVGEEGCAVEVMKLLCAFKSVRLENIMKYLLRYEEDSAIRHLFYVACGLDSMVVGEDEILGQVKEDYQLAKDIGSTGYYLNTLFRYGISCAKKIKTKTLLSKTAISVGTLTAHAVADFVSESPEGLKKVCIIGISGKMGTIVMKNIYGGKNVEVTGTIRSHNLPPEVITIYSEVKMIDYKDRYDRMKESDIIISATASPHYTLTAKECEKYLTDGKKRLFIDLAVPMDIDKAIANIEGVTLYDIDYFRKLAKANNQAKNQEVKNAEAFIVEAVEEYQKEILFREFLPRIELLDGLVQEKSAKSMLYQLKSELPSEEFKIILKGMEVLLTKETS